jgi:tRNA1(Val) A37 N6-methylase TrmN6
LSCSRNTEQLTVIVTALSYTVCYFHRLQVYNGDLYSALPSTTAAAYSTILANPPYIANPSNIAPLAVFGDGGYSGETLLAAIMAGAAQRLLSNGCLLVVSNLVNPAAYSDKV